MIEQKIWELLKQIAHCNGEGCHAELPRCHDYGSCRAKGVAVLALISDIETEKDMYKLAWELAVQRITLIASEQQPMVEALRMCKGKFLQLKMNKVLDTSHYIKQIDAALKGEGK